MFMLRIVFFFAAAALVASCATSGTPVSVADTIAAKLKAVLT